MAVLTTFNGDAWDAIRPPRAAAQAIAQPGRARHGRPPRPARARFDAHVPATVTIDNLESTLLPLPPTTTSVGSVATVVPGFGAVQPVESPPGETFTAVAHLPVKPGAADRPSGSRDRGAAWCRPRRSPRTWRCRPSPRRSSGSPTRSWRTPPIPRPRPPPWPGGSTPDAPVHAVAAPHDGIRTRSPRSSSSPGPGSAEQFAAAYAVLARLDGLPTRVAMGFTTGAAQAYDRYAVTGADADVARGLSGTPDQLDLLRADTGLVERADGIGVDAGSHTTGQPCLPTSATSSTITPATTSCRPGCRGVDDPARAPAQRGRERGSDRRRAGDGGGGPRRRGARRRRGAVDLGPAAPAAAFTGLDRWRARRMRRPASGDAGEEVLARWREAAWILDRGRLGKMPSETLQEHEDRLGSLARAQWLGSYRAAPAAKGPQPETGQVEAAVAAYAALAALAARAAYGDDPCTAEEARHAVDLGAVAASDGPGPGRAGRGGWTGPVPAMTVSPCDARGPGARMGGGGPRRQEDDVTIPQSVRVDDIDLSISSSGPRLGSARGGVPRPASRAAHRFLRGPTDRGGDGHPHPARTRRLRRDPLRRRGGDQPAPRAVLLGAVGQPPSSTCPPELPRVLRGSMTTRRPPPLPASPHRVGRLQPAYGALPSRTPSSRWPSYIIA